MLVIALLILLAIAVSVILFVVYEIAKILFAITVVIVLFGVLTKTLKKICHSPKAQKQIESFEIEQPKAKQRPRLSGYELERFMVYCNAKLEHDEQMKEYKEYYNIKD